MKDNIVIYNNKEYDTCICLNSSTKLLPFHNDLFMIEIMLNDDYSDDYKLTAVKYYFYF
jgi:hypothetical protein